MTVRRIAACVALVAACAAPPNPMPPDSSPTASPTSSPQQAALVVQAGDVGAEVLVLLDPATGAVANLAPPPGGLGLLAPGWGPRVAVTGRAGSVALGAVSGPGVTWQSIALRGEVRAAALSPGGGHVAAVVAAGEQRAPFEIVVVDLADGSAARVEVAAELDGAPVWLDDRAVAVPTIESGDERRLTTFNLETEATESRASQLVDLTRSAHGTRFASGHTIYEGSILDGAQPVAEVAPEVGFGSIALDGSGTRLAVIVVDDNGDATAIAVHDEARGWQQTARFGIPGASKRAFVAWVP